MKAILPLILIIGSFTSGAQTNVLIGQIQTKKGEPIPNCIVKVKGMQISAVSDVCGQFEIDLVNLADFNLEINMIGFENWQLGAERLSGQTKVIIKLIDFPEMKNKYCKGKRKFRQVKEIVLNH
ncbi:MAG: hypothetical protein QM762_13700 [Chryseolinea sp.]